MKRLLISVSIILLITLLSCAHVFTLKQFTGELIGQLETASLHLSQDRWSNAGQTVDAVYAAWEEQEFYLHTTLRHADIDEIRTTLREVQAYLNSREDTAECQALIAKLINQLELLLEAELPTIKNLL